MKRFLIAVILAACCAAVSEAQLTSIPGGLWIPGYYGATDRFAFADTFTLNDSDDKVAAIFQVPKTGSIDRVGIRTGTVTVSDTLKVGIYTVDTATGAPTATAYGGMVAGTQGTLSTDSWYTVSLGTAASATRGDVIAAVIEFNSFVAGNLALSHVSANSSYRANRPYRAQYEASWTVAGTGGNLVLAIEYDDNTVDYVPGTYPWSAITVTNFNSGTTPDEYALKFKLPFPARISGFGTLWTGQSNGDFDAVLYDSDGTTVLESLSVDNDLASATNALWGYGHFDTPVTLSKDTFYYLSLKPTSVTNVSVATMDVSAAVFLDQVEGGQNFHLATKTDAGAFSATTTSRPFIFLQFDQFDAGASSGGASSYTFVQ